MAFHRGPKRPFLKAATVVSEGLRIPVILLDSFACIGCAVWIGPHVSWAPFLWGVLGLIGGVFVIGFALLPALALFVLPSVRLMRTDPRAAMPLVFLSTVYRFAVYLAWCLLVLRRFTSVVTKDSLVPLFVWASVVGSGPIILMAFKAKNRDIANLMIVIPSIGFMCTGFWWFYREPTFAAATVLFGIIMLLGACASFLIVVETLGD